MHSQLALSILRPRRLLLLLLFFASYLVSSPGTAGSERPQGHVTANGIMIELKNGNFASFTNTQHPGNRIGYRFFEHQPITHREFPARLVGEAGMDPDRIPEMEAEYQNRAGVKIYKRTLDHVEGWVNQRWIFYLAPTEDGVDMLWVIETYEEGLPKYYGAQQCFRMSGISQKKAWKKEVALTPAFSEYDLWATQKGSKDKTSLTYVVRNNQWQELSAIESCTGARTPLGIQVDKLRGAGALPDVVGPYEATMLAPADCGLITRTDLAGAWVCGIFWENTSHVTDHHPADCLHAIVNIGNIPARGKRAIRGKIYWFRGTKGELLRKWRSDFLQSAGSKG